MSLDTTRSANRPWIDTCIAAGAGFFLFALFLSAAFDPTIRLLHLLQAMIYIALLGLTRRRSPWGFGAGFFIAVFWNYTNLFVTTFVKAGWHAFLTLVRTGQLQHPDLLVALVAAAGHFLIIAACVVGFLELRPRARQWAEFLGGGCIAVAYFVAIIFTTGPQYIGLVRRVFRV